jgi:hypothetical protein
MAATAGGNGDRSAWHADPWHKMRFGWIEPQIEELKPLAMPIRLVAPGVPDATGARILYSPSRGSSEYFILEFRNPTTRRHRNHHSPVSRDPAETAVARTDLGRASGVARCGRSFPWNRWHQTISRFAHSEPLWKAR